MMLHTTGRTRQVLERLPWLLIGLISLFLVAGAGPVLADCTDNDGDGYGSPASSDCTYDTLDCNDSDAAVNPGATEICDSIDNNCDGSIDETFHVGEGCAVGDPTGCSFGDAGGCCLTAGVNVCRLDHTGTFCQVGVEGPTHHSQEGPAGSPSCFDLVDNDCDGLTDHQQAECQSAELCNGFDDDNNGLVDDTFPGLGTACDNGLSGACKRSGTVVCTDDQLGTRCNAPIGTPTSENTPGEGACLDGIDNDCDGLTDLADPGCQQAEKCDGKDNDGDGLVDEDFTDLGDPCSVGVGACQASGAKVCRSDTTGTECGAVPSLAGTEGPSGATCTDGIDNDCDGHTDGADSGCSSALLQASCALPYVVGQPGNDCNGKHQIVFSTSGAGPDAVVTAELLALDINGNILSVLPVRNGDLAQLASRLSPADFKAVSRTTKRITTHQVFAPIPMLRVTVKDGLNQAQAFCSNIPYLQVLEPSGTVVSESQGDVTHVLAAIPLVNPASLIVKVDGVNILPALSINPATKFPGGPYGGSVVIHGQTVTVSDLVVGSAAVGTPSSNSLTMNLSGLGCGGHIVVVDADKRPGSFPDFPAAACDKDDIRDKATSMGFAIQIDSPTPGEVTSAVPTPVTGRICHGRPIASAQINGLPLDTSGATFTPGDGEDSADTYILPINTALGRTDLGLDLASGNAPAGTFDAGSNRLVADATDDTGHRTFKTLVFATGNVAAPGIGSLASVLRDQLQQGLDSLIADRMNVVPLSPGVEVPNAFVVGLTPEAVQTLFTKKCQDAGPKFVDTVTAKIEAIAPIFKSISGGCSCNPNVRIGIVDASGDPADISCPVTFMDGKIHVSIHLPKITVQGHAGGYCKTTFLGICTSETIVNIDGTSTISNMRLDFDVTEAQLLGGAPPPPAFVTGTSSVITSGGSEVNCLAAACNWVIEGLVTIFTFGTVDLDLSPSLNIANEVDFTQAVGASEPDPVKLDQIKVDEEEVASFGQLLKGDLETVHITPGGLTAGLKGTFATTAVDPEIEAMPGAVLSPAPAPATPVSGGGDAYVVLADDTFNQLFASMAASGKLKLGCQDSGKTVGNLLPADCETLSGATVSATALVQGICHGVRGDDCELQSGPTASATNIEQGTCHGVKGDACATIAVTGLGIEERLACNATPNLNLNSATKLLFCVKQEVPPRLLIQDNPATAPVETALRLNDLSVAMVADRGNNGLDGELSSVPKCFASGAPTTGDCNLFAACLDLNFLTNLQFQTCSDGKPGIVTAFQGIQVLSRVPGVVCGGATSADDGLVAGTAAES
ncbi:MAG TPA: putative metal-binding motif-containing protein, partial [Candidatus Polarisedimenticolia bacterium]|nr:putative metal-binding motif-containing protein [Candidatus Polarisedimenticolia bacterium]